MKCRLCSEETENKIRIDGKLDIICDDCIKKLQEKNNEN
jgi:ribosome-binding protein aMBF1 (putative translation factor)